MEKSDLCEELSKKMRVGKKRGGLAKNPGLGLGLGTGVVRFTRSMSGKRIAISSKTEVNSPAMKKQCGENSAPAADKSLLEALPQEVLVKILCGVDHDDLKQIFQVSKPMREATLIARQWHFAYSTPRKTISSRNSMEFADDDIDTEKVNAPNAPKQEMTYRPRLSEKSLAAITMALFA